jgi:ATP-binding cassette subfamily B protein
MPDSQTSPIVRLLNVGGEKKFYLLVSTVIAVVAAIVSLAPYIITYIVLGMLLQPSFDPDHYSEVFKLGVLAIILAIVHGILLIISFMASHIAAFDILYSLRSKLCAHLGRLSMGYFTTRRTGAIKKVLTEDVEGLESFIAHHIPDVVSGLTLPLAIVIYLCSIDLKLALVALLPVPFALFLQQYTFAKANKENFREKYHQALEDLNGTIVEYVRGMPVVKIFNHTATSFTKLKEAALNYKKFIELSTLSTAPAWAVFVVITSSGLLFILPFGVYFYLHDDIGLPTLFLFFMLGAGYMTPLLKLALMGAQLGHLILGLDRVEAILAEQPLSEPENPLVPKGGSIEFKNVSFGYGETKVLHNIRISIPEGHVVALVGPSGAGKTTIAKLLLRMWDIQEGAILLGGVDVRSMRLQDLMAHVSFVFQDGFLFSDTLRENIRMGMEGVGDEDIIRAANAAQCQDFIEKMPRGLDTKVGEGGEVHLSGGEKQRISMARIILKNSPVVVLDEATAFADAENEARIQAAFAELMQGKTVVVIAHRLSTITDADRIYVLDEGKVVQSGTHEELAAQTGLYAHMWEAHMSAQDWSLKTEETAC